MHTPPPRSSTFALLVLTALYAVAYRFLPYDVQAFCLWPMCALGLFSGARLKFGPALALSLLLQIATDAIFYLTKQWEPVPYVYPCLLLNVCVGRWLLAATPGVGRVGLVGCVSFVVFFVVTNLGSWLHTALPEYRPHTLATMLLSLEQGIEYIRARPGQWLGTPTLAILLFGADHAWARATLSSAEKVR